MENTEYLALGRKIADCRRRTGLSQREFARTIGLSPSYLGKLECGNGLSGVSLQILISIAKGFGIHLSELLSLDNHDRLLAYTYLNQRKLRLKERLKRTRLSTFCS